jgi:hypothetical protein
LPYWHIKNGGRGHHHINSSTNHHINYLT